MSKKVTKEWALDFLRAHQPLPADSDFDDDSNALEDWEVTIEYLIEHPCEEAIPLVLNSFGGGNGYGLYRDTLDFIKRFPIETIVPYLTEALRSPNVAGREMVAEIAAEQVDRINTDSISPAFLESIKSFAKATIDVLVNCYPKMDKMSCLDSEVLGIVVGLDEKLLLDWEKYGQTILECRERDSDEDNLEMYDEIIEHHRG